MEQQVEQWLPPVAAEVPLTFGLLAFGRTLHAYGAELLLREGLHPGQELILMLLIERGPMTQAAIQRVVGLDHSVVSRSVRRMAEAGLLVREPSANDARAVVVGTTERGTAMGDVVERIWRDVDRVLRASLDEADALGLQQQIEQLQGALVTARTGRG